MKHVFSLSFLFIVCSSSYAQKEDYIWLSGYDSQYGFDTSWGFYFGNTALDFNYSPREVQHDSVKMNFDKTTTTYSDSNGNLLFYTNGIYIANSLDEKIENSDSLSPGYLTYVWDPNIATYGYRVPHAIYAIQSLSNNNQYYVVHTLNDLVGSEILGICLFYELLDLSENGGHGKVLQKNQVVISDTIANSFAITRHANGKDWWILVQKRKTNCYYRALLTDSGVELLPNLTCCGDTFISRDFGPHAFSPDGNKLFTIGFYGGLHIYDFNRCTGELSNPLYLPLPVLVDSGWIGMGVAASPNNRFLYACATLHLYQFDLWAPDVWGSIDTIGIFDGTSAPFWAVFNTAQNGPDGKIYISCGNADTVYHVIERPDEKGDSCLFRQHSLSLPSPSLGVPSFPNYRLGALTGGPCDTLTGLNEELRAEKEKKLKVFPNPASDVLIVDYGFTDWSKGDVSLEIVNELGQIIYQKQLPRYSGFQKIDVSSYPSGVYTTCIKRNGQVVAAGKFAKE